MCCKNEILPGKIHADNLIRRSSNEISASHIWGIPVNDGQKYTFGRSAVAQIFAR